MLSRVPPSPPIKTPPLRRGFAKTHWNPEIPRFSNSNSKRLRIVAHGVSSGGDNGAFANGFGLVSDEGFSWVESNTNGAHGSDVTGASRTVTHGSRSGLLRTPMSGGVQSATSVHDLPRPALAVRNLMEQEWARKQYRAKHQQLASQQWGDCYYYKMENISDIFFIGGLGTVAWIGVKEYENLQPDKIVVDGGEQNLRELNALFSKPLREILSTEEDVDDAAFISMDSKGTDFWVQQGAQVVILMIHG